MLLEIVEGLLTRWPALLFAALPFLLTAGISTLFFLVHQIVSGRDPEELPLTTGEWVEQAVDRLGLSRVKVGPTDPLLSGMEGYIPHAGYLALQPSTYRHRGPAHWAMGAHELGHALHLQHPGWRGTFLSGRAVSQAAGRLVAAGLVGACLLGGSALLWFTGAMLLLALAADAVVLLDEAWASWTAFGLLREDPRLSAGQRRRAMASAAAALAAHVAGSVARVLLLVLWIPITGALTGPWVSDLAAAPWPVLLFVTGLTLVLGKRAVRVGIRAFLPRREERLSDLNTRIAKERAGDFGGGLGALFLVGVALTLPRSIPRDLAVLLALVPALVPISDVLSGFVLLPLRLLRDEIARLGRQEALLEAGVTPEDRLTAASGVKTPDGLTAKVAILDMHNRPSALMRAMELLRVLYVPLVIVIWAEAIRALTG